MQSEIPCHLIPCLSYSIYTLLTHRQQLLVLIEFIYILCLHATSLRGRGAAATSIHSRLVIVP